MQRQHRWVGLVVGLAGLLLATEPVAAAGAASTTAQFINGLADRLLWVAVPVTLLTEGVLFYAIWRFRRNDTPRPTQERRWLEISWTLATALILLFVGVSAYSVMAHPSVTPTRADAVQTAQGNDAVVVNVTGSQWYWTFEYQGENVTTQGTLELPANRPVVMRITSSDVIHSVFIPKLGIKKDAIPGQTNYVVTTIENGSVGQQYVLFCAEYCGRGHSDMTATVNVFTPAQYQQWLASQRAGGSGSAGSTGVGSQAAGSGQGSASGESSSGSGASNASGAGAGNATATASG